MKRQRKQNSLFVLLVLALVLVGGVLLYFKTNIVTKEKPQAQQQTKTFKSSTAMDFTIEIPANYEIRENLSRVTIKGKGAEIEIGLIGTNYQNLIDHLSDSRNNILKDLTNREDLTINSFQVIKGFLEGEKKYYILANNSVYFLSTDSESLYADLDHIAQSFRYTP